MTDAHCHIGNGETRHLLCEPFGGERGEGDRVFYGTHPWFLESFDPDRLRARLGADASAGVGEIGLDRLRDREISPRMREVFAAQLEIAAEFHRPVVLHGAKCWGEVVRACQPHCGKIPAFLFHGFSRSGGLIPDIVALNGFISVGPALLNDHAVNYRELVRAIPSDRLLVESDRTPENAAETPSVVEIARKLADLLGMSERDGVARFESNLAQFLK